MTASAESQSRLLCKVIYALIYAWWQVAVRSGTAAIRNVGASGEVDAGFRDEKVLLRLCVMAVCKCLQFWASPCLHLGEKSWKIIEKGPKIILQAESNQNTSWRKIIRLYAHVCVYIYSSSFNYNDVKVNIKHDLMWFCNRIKQNKQLLKNKKADWKLILWRPDAFGTLRLTSDPCAGG